MTRLIISRHGETEWNVQGRYQGNLDSPLTSAGIAQSQALAKRLSSVQFTALYCSDLLRARHTADFIAHRTGHTIQVDARLRERHLGVFEGLTKAEVGQRHPEAYQKYKEGRADEAPSGGESIRQSTDRFSNVLNEIALRHAGEQIVVIAHGSVLSYFLRKIIGAPLDGPRRVKRFNGSWNVFILEDENWFLETWGDISHLKSSATIHEH